MTDDPNAIGPWETRDGYRQRVFLHRLHPFGGIPMTAATASEDEVSVWIDRPSQTDGLGSWAEVGSVAVADALLARLYPPAPGCVEAQVAGIVAGLAAAVAVAVRHRQPGVAREISEAGKLLVAQVRAQPTEER